MSDVAVDAERIERSPAGLLHHQCHACVPVDVECPNCVDGEGDLRPGATNVYPAMVRPEPDGWPLPRSGYWAVLRVQQGSGVADLCRSHSVMFLGEARVAELLKEGMGEAA